MWSSCRDRGQLDDGIIAQRSDRFQAHVAAPLDGLFVILFEQQRADEARDRLFIGEESHDVGTALDLAIETFDCKRCGDPTFY